MTKMTKNKRNRSPRETSVYRGPIHLPAGALDLRTTRINIAYKVNFSTNGSGVIAGYYSTSDVTSASDWTSLAGLFQEYRVLGMEMAYQNANNKTYVSTLLPAYGKLGVYHNPVTSSPANLDEVVQNVDNINVHTGAPFKVQWKARGFEEMQFLPITTTNTEGGFRYYLDQGTVSKLMGFAYLTFLVEFRGRL